MSPTLELEEPLVEILDAPDETAGLVTIKRTRVSDLFEAPGLMQMLLNRIQEEAKTFIPDTSTPKGRDLIASQAFRVSKTKTYLEGLGKALVDDLKERPKRVDATRKLMRDSLDALRDAQRQPLTEWEAERDRQRAIVEEIRKRPTTLQDATADQISAAIETLEGEGCAIPGAAEAKAEALQAMLGMLENRRTYEAEQAELKRLREEKEKRDRLDKEEALRKEGEERARKALEATATNPAPAPIGEGPDGPCAPPALAKAAFPDDFPSVSPIAPAPLCPPSTGDKGPAPNADLEHRRAFNREALADLHTAIFQDRGQTTLDIEPIAKAVLTAIATGKVRHISITY